MKGVIALAALAPPLEASSHMDAPLFASDDAADTADVYAFVTERDATKYLTTAVAVYPVEDPGIGPSQYTFDDNVLYSIHVATGGGEAVSQAILNHDFAFNTAPGHQE